MVDNSLAREEWTDVLGNPHVMQRIWWRLRFLSAWTWLLLTIRGRRTRGIWIGDSHAMTFNQAMESGTFMRANGGLVLRAGARLMYSLGHKGFTPQIRRVAEIIGRTGRPGTYVPFYVAGEIDVRTQMAARPQDDLSWVEVYVDRCLELSATMRAPQSYFVAPPPPYDLSVDQSWYPVTGTIEERLTESRRLRVALREAVAARPGAEFLDLTDVICDDRGQLRDDLTTDGCHTNLAGVALIQDRLRELGLTQVG